MHNGTNISHNVLMRPHHGTGVGSQADFGEREVSMQAIRVVLKYLNVAFLPQNQS
jgi:hypothetical protein